MLVYQTMTEIAAEALRERILTGQYPPGSRLKPCVLEHELNLGRMAIREGLKELIASGLIIQEANKGVCVAGPPSAAELEALFDARCALEGKAAVMAATKMNEKTIGELERLHEEMKDPGEPVEYFLLNRRFHLTLYKASGWAHAVACIINLLDQVISCFAPGASRLTLNFKPFNRDHSLILDALRGKGTDDLHDLVVENINRGRQLNALALQGKPKMGGVKIAALKSRPSNAHSAKGGIARGKSS